MITLAAPTPLLQTLRAQLWHDRSESAAILLCTPVKLHETGDWRLIVREAHVAPDSAYEIRTDTSVQLRPEFGLPLEKKARLRGWSIAYVHTHPTQVGPASFSAIDDAAEIPLAEYALARSPGVPHLGLVLARESLAARRLGTREPVRVLEVGSTINLLSDWRLTSDVENGDKNRLDRQIRAFGLEGQRRLSLMHVGIGLGGTGSLVAQQLAHLGVRRFTLVDNDVLAASNLNRTVGATNDLLGEPKVGVAARMIRTISPDAQVSALVSDVLEHGAGRRIAEVDLIFCCTDSHASRHLLNQLSYQFLVPAIDLGVAIDTQNAVQFAGHVKALAPGLPCLWCINHLDPRRVREEMMSAEHREADPYFTGGSGEPQPSVISINATVSSIAVTMFLAMTAGVPSAARYVIYDGNRTRVSSVAATVDESCNFCSMDSTAFAGDAFPLPERRNAAG